MYGPDLPQVLLLKSVMASLNCWTYIIGAVWESLGWPSETFNVAGKQYGVVRLVRAHCWLCGASRGGKVLLQTGVSDSGLNLPFALNPRCSSAREASRTCTW